MKSAAFHTILVGDDGAPDAERAVAIAVSLAGGLQARLIVLGVIEPPSAESQAEGYGLDRGVEARKMLEEKFSRLQESAAREGVSLTTEIVAGDPEEMIEQRAEAEAVDLIVVGPRAVTRVRRWLEGSTSENLVRKAKPSVLVVHDSDR